MSTIINPVPAALPATAESLDRKIEILRQFLDLNIPWLTGRSFGRAKAIPRIVDATKGTTQTEPLVYANDGEYYPLYPNDALTAFSFWTVQKGRVPYDYRHNSLPKNFTAPVSLVVWGDLGKIDPEKDYIFTEELINQILRVLDKSRRVEITKVIDENIKLIYQGFDIDPSRLGLLMHPYFAFRIEMNLDYMIECYDAVISNVPNMSIVAQEGSIIQYHNGAWRIITLQELNTQLADTPI